MPEEEPPEEELLDDDEPPEEDPPEEDPPDDEPPEDETHFPELGLQEVLPGHCIGIIMHRPSLFPVSISTNF